MAFMNNVRTMYANSNIQCVGSPFTSPLTAQRITGTRNKGQRHIVVIAGEQQQGQQSPLPSETCVGTGTVPPLKMNPPVKKSRPAVSIKKVTSTGWQLVPRAIAGLMTVAAAAVADRACRAAKVTVAKRLRDASAASRHEALKQVGYLSVLGLRSKSESAK